MTLEKQAEALALKPVASQTHYIEDSIQKHLTQCLRFDVNLPIAHISYFHLIVYRVILLHEASVYWVYFFTAQATPQNGNGAGPEAVIELPDTLPATPEELRLQKSTPLQSPQTSTPKSSTTADSSPTGVAASGSQGPQVTW